MSARKERSSSNGSPGTTPTPPPASGLQTEEGTATRPRVSSSETPVNQSTGFDPSMMEKFFSFMSFYEQHQQGAPAQSNNSNNNNNNVTPMSLDGSSYARGNQQQQPTFAPTNTCFSNNTTFGNSRNNIGSSRNNIGSSRNNIGSSRDNIGSSRNTNNTYTTSRRFFNGVATHR
ncbi:unnamed protein product [Closterium sp. NIES-54]